MLNKLYINNVSMCEEVSRIQIDAEGLVLIGNINEGAL